MSVKVGVRVGVGAGLGGKVLLRVRKGLGVKWE